MSFTIVYNEKTPFQATKTRGSTSRKSEIFPNGLVHGFGETMAIFSIFLFQAIQASKMSFIIVLNEKTPLQAIKARSSKSRKIEIFPKGLVHGFGQKFAFFPSFNFRQYTPAKCLLRQSTKKKRLSRLQKQEVQKVEKLRFFQRGEFMVLVKSWPFFLLILRNIGKQNVFYDSLERKNAFLDHKDIKLQRSKN